MYDTITLLAVLRGLAPFDPFLLRLFFPNVVNFTTAEIAFDKIAPDMRLAPFVSPMVAGVARKADGYETRKFKPAYVKPKDVVDPERTLIRRAGEAIGGALSAADRRNAIIADILMKQRDQIYYRQEWMAAQAMLTGKVIVEGEGYPRVEVDFGRDANNTVDMTGLGTSRWGEADADPLQDIEDWGELAESPITTLVMDRLAYRKMVKNQAVKDLLDTRRGSRSELELGPDGGKLYSYKGALGDIEVWVYSGYYKDEDGNKVFFIPANTVIASSAAVDGVRAFGAILDAKAGYQPLEIFPKNWPNEDPAVEYVMSQSAPLMVPRRVDATVTATVH